MAGRRRRSAVARVWTRAACPFVHTRYGNTRDRSEPVTFHLAVRGRLLCRLLVDGRPDGLRRQRHREGVLRRMHRRDASLEVVESKQWRQPALQNRDANRAGHERPLERRRVARIRPDRRPLVGVTVGEDRHQTSLLFGTKERDAFLDSCRRYMAVIRPELVGHSLGEAQDLARLGPQPGEEAGQLPGPFERAQPQKPGVGSGQTAQRLRRRPTRRQTPFQRCLAKTWRADGDAVVSFLGAGVVSEPKSGAGRWKPHRCTSSGNAAPLPVTSTRAALLFPQLPNGTVSQSSTGAASNPREAAESLEQRPRRRSRRRARPQASPRRRVSGRGRTRWT